MSRHCVGCAQWVAITRTFFSEGGKYPLLKMPSPDGSGFVNSHKAGKNGKHKHIRDHYELGEELGDGSAATRQHIEPATLDTPQRENSAVGRVGVVNCRCRL